MDNVIISSTAQLRLITYILELTNFNTNNTEFNVLDNVVFNNIYDKLVNNEYIDFVVKINLVDGTSVFYRPVATKGTTITIMDSVNDTIKAMVLELNNDSINNNPKVINKSDNVLWEYIQ